VGYIRQIIITIEDDPGTIQDESRLAAKYPNNTTVVHMDKNGNYKVVHGLKLNKIPKGDIKVIINGHVERYFPEEPSSESIIIFLPSKRTITGAGLTLTLASLIPCSRNLGEEIAEHISIIDRATGEDSGVRKVSLASCSLGEKYAIKLLPKLREQGISDAKVSVISPFGILFNLSPYTTL
jgi:hypothetical protein